MQIAFNPVLTTNAAGSFSKTSEGFIQGTALNDPAVRNELAGGTLKSDAALPMWGGVGISELVPTGTPSNSLGGVVDRATNVTDPGDVPAAGALTGFSVFDQDHAMINTPQSPVPLAGGNMLVNFYRFGSGARITVKADPSLVDLQGNLITTQVSWDFSDQRLIPGVLAYAADVIAAASWAAGVVTLTLTTGGEVAVGDDFTISGMTPAGYNGSYTAVAGTAGVTLKYDLAVDPGAATVMGQLDAGGGFLPVRVLDVSVGNSMVVEYDPVTGFATWDRSGTTANILI